MNNILWILTALASLAILNMLVLRFTKKTKIDEKQYEGSNYMLWQDKAKLLLNRINKYRLDNDVPPLRANDDMLILSKKRVQYWIYEELEGEELHQNIFKHKRPYHEMGFKKIGECASYGYEQSVFEKWQNSKKGHNEYMLDPKFTVAGLFYDDNKKGDQLTCLILGEL